MIQPLSLEKAMPPGWRPRRWLGLGAGIGLVALGLLACARMDATNQFNALQIVQVQALSDSDCTVPAARTSVTHQRGILDVDLPRSSSGTLPRAYTYKLPLLITNNLESVGGGRATEMNNIILTHFTVELSAPGVNWSDPKSCPAAGTLDTETFSYQLGPGGGSLGTHVTVVNPYQAPCLLNVVAQQPLKRFIVTATVTAKGIHGGTTIKSAPLVFPIEVCAGCLQTYNDPFYAQYSYPNKYPQCAALSGTVPYQGAKCFDPGQDEPIVCCGMLKADGTVDVLCPAMVPVSATGTVTQTSTMLSTSP